MKRELELLAPGGDIDSIKAAIAAGASAVYCGLDRFNARNRAENISFDSLYGILKLAHKNHCQVFITLNVLVTESELTAFIALLNRLVNTSIDGIIIQDLGMFYLVSNYFKSLSIHASTQLTTHNSGQLLFLNKLSATRVNLSRELNIDEIKHLAEIGDNNGLLTEVFVHGSNCLSFSGACYISSLHGGNSGNRGRCSQPCRDAYVTTELGNDFPLNLKDNSAFSDLDSLVKAGVDSLKIEGRIKKYHYVFTVVDAWRKQLDKYTLGDVPKEIDADLYKVFNRGFTNGFLKGDITKNMFIDNPRDHSAIYRATELGGVTDENLECAKRELYEEKTEIFNDVKFKIERLSTENQPLHITVSGAVGSPLKITATSPHEEFIVETKSLLKSKGTSVLNADSIVKRLKTVNENSAYFIDDIAFDGFNVALYLPFKEITELKNRLLALLNNIPTLIAPFELPKAPVCDPISAQPKLAVLIDSVSDVVLCNDEALTFYFKLPDDFSRRYDEFVALFIQNRELIPWFPSIVIGEAFDVVVRFLETVKPQLLVANNTGIGFVANELGLPWIAGPYLNSVNSFTLLCLKEQFNCVGAFVSNELNEVQIKTLKSIPDFKLHYTIYHPALLMTSRQCLFHQVTGCEKSAMDSNCVAHCKKSASITNLKESTFILDKSEGNHPTVYNAFNVLNTAIVNDIPNRFTSFLIDLRVIKTNTKVTADKVELIALFKALLSGNSEAETKIHDMVSPTVNSQYKKGI